MRKPYNGMSQYSHNGRPKPKPSMLGSGMAQKAAKKVQSRKRRVQGELSRIMGEMRRGR